MEFDPRPTICVVISSGGYPGSYEKGHAISGIEDADALDDVKVFHAGTGAEDGKITAIGGRVLGVTAAGDDLKGAIDQAYKAVEKISWKDCYFRRDIGAKAMNME